MSYYVKRGNIPHKRHTRFRKPDGSLYAEELVSSKGFSGICSLLYHNEPPTVIKAADNPEPVPVNIAKGGKLEPVHLRTLSLKSTGTDFIKARIPVMTNNDVTLWICNGDALSIDYYYKNGEADEVLFLHEGSGYIDSQFGRLRVVSGDYIVIPRTTIYQFKPDAGFVRMLVIESAAPVETVKRYRNEFGQLLEHSPYCERDMRPPEELIINKEAGDYVVKVKKQGHLHSFHYKYSPFDVVGWDGFLYPYAFSIHDFEPITGRIHQPPPVHQTFQAAGFVICSFVPRLFDYHPEGIPAPYNHSNIDSDEVLYYVGGNFMSRKGIDKASFTLHPGGIPHGPHPGTVEASLDVKETHELAVMVDTFRPLFITEQALDMLDENYLKSWLA